ncbi:hypothetical protein NC652_016514 [Populus alba x Populus x berolinensis]|nr:hypothetical protein NC652_016514 [Populus alba x Populus x berolinensis]
MREFPEAATVSVFKLDKLSRTFHQVSREVSRLFGLEEVDYPVLEPEALFIRKAGEEIRDQCWRYERMTRGWRREHYQWNMDIIGVPEVTAEAELISSIVTCFKQIGISASDVGFKVNSRKVLQEILRSYSLSENLFAKVCVIIDKMVETTCNKLRVKEKGAKAPYLKAQQH